MKPSLCDLVSGAGRPHGGSCTCAGWTARHGVVWFSNSIKFKLNVKK